MKRPLFLCAAALASAQLSLAQVATFGPETGTFNFFTRGYFFTAPVDFTITGMNVLTQNGSSNGFQNFAVIRFDGAMPPPFNISGVNTFTQLALGQDLDQTVFQPVSVNVNAGDLIGIYGNTTATPGETLGQSSYAGVTAQSIMIGGNSVPLTRSGMQMHLGSATTPLGMQDVWAEPPNLDIVRVEFSYVVGLNTFCDPANNNSTGVPTVMTASTGSGVGSGAHLEASQGPPGEFGYFLVGTSFSEPGIIINAGRLCVSGQIGRFNLTGGVRNSLGLFNAAGVLDNSVGTATSSGGTGYDVPVSMPISGSPIIMPGSTWHFQLWHREAAGSSNFSNGVSLLF